MGSKSWLRASTLVLACLLLAGCNDPPRRTTSPTGFGAPPPPAKQSMQTAPQFPGAPMPGSGGPPTSSYPGVGTNPSAGPAFQPGPSGLAPGGGIQPSAGGLQSGAKALPQAYPPGTAVPMNQSNFATRDIAAPYGAPPASPPLSSSVQNPSTPQPFRP